MSEEIKDIRVVPESECCGCAACANACPVDAIRMEEGKEGFIFPKVDLNTCIQCGKCVKTCPVLEIDRPNRKEPDCRAAYGADEIRKVSSSGAIFTLLADYVFQRGGVVYGVALNDEFEIEHRRITSMEELSALRRSKYVQSRVGLSYRQVKQDLKNGKTVLFSGTPCQNAGLRKYLGKTDTEKLILADIVCHGVPSQSVFNEYLRERFPKDDLKEFLFRTKDAGQNCMVCLATRKDGSREISDINEDAFEKGFHKSLFLRESCAQCHFAAPPRQGDFTIGDFWGLEKYNPDYKDPLGVSEVLLNNEKADRIWMEIKPKLKFDEPVPVDFAVKHNRYRTKTRIHPDRARFFELRGQAPLSVVVDAVLENCSLEEVQKARKKAKLKGKIKKLTPAPVKELAKKVLRKIR